MTMLANRHESSGVGVCVCGGGCHVLMLSIKIDVLSILGERHTGNLGLLCLRGPFVLSYSLHFM